MSCLDIQTSHALIHLWWQPESHIRLRGRESLNLCGSGYLSLFMSACSLSSNGCHYEVIRYCYHINFASWWIHAASLSLWSTLYGGKKTFGATRLSVSLHLSYSILVISYDFSYLERLTRHLDILRHVPLPHYLPDLLLRSLKVPLYNHSINLNVQ